MPEHTEELLRLVQLAVLDTVEFAEVAARRLPSQTESDPPRFDLRIQVDEPSADAERRVFGFGLRVAIRIPQGEVVVEPFVQYHVAAEHAGLLDDRATVAAFANEVAVMTLIPYARQSIADVSQRVFNSSIMMPILRQGQLNFGSGGPAS